MSDTNLNPVPPTPRGPAWRGHVVSHQNHEGAFIDELVIDQGTHDATVYGSRFKGHGMMGVNIPGRGRQEIPYTFDIPAETIEQAFDPEVLKKASEEGAQKALAEINERAKAAADAQRKILTPGNGMPLSTDVPRNPMG